MNARFDKLIALILRHEGGFVNDKADNGKATNYGVSLRFAAGTGNLKLFDVDLDGDIDALDIRALDQARAIEAFLEYFYMPMRIDQLDDNLLAAHLFDHCVNAGNRAATLMLQRILGITADGIMGPVTVAYANDFDGIGKKYEDARLKFYFGIANRNPKARKWINGWVNRVKDTAQSI